MGVKTKIQIDEINTFFKVKSLTPTVDGICDTVYILDDKYILKLFENSTFKSLKEESKLLDICEGLCVSKIIKPPFIFKNKPAIIYEKASGKTLEFVDVNSIKQIGKFLKDFHKLTQNKSSTNTKLFEKQRVQNLIYKTKYTRFQTIFDDIDIELKEDGIIHGDLFVDNTVFKNKKLSCVFDFGGACCGDFILDLAIVALSWCKDEKEYELLLEVYGLDIKMDIFIKYIKYGMLYYSIKRYLIGENYEELLKRCESI